MTKQEKEEYKNDQIHVVVNYKPGCIVEYEVEAFRPLCIESRKRAAKSIGKEVVVPGFRKGKAPIEIVAKRYPHDLDKRWQENIANIAYKQSAEFAKIPPVRQDSTISFKMHSHSADRAKLTLSFETIPKIPSIDPAKCHLKKVKRPEVSEEKVHETIRQTQMFFSKWETITSRPVKEKDFLLLDVEIMEEDPPQKLFENTRFEVTDKSMAQWMKKLVLGKTPGDVLEGVSIPDATLSEKEKKEFPPKKVRVTIKAIEEAKLPELTDEFAKQLGAKSVEDLHTKIHTLLTKKADEGEREEKREQVTEFLLSHHFEIPSSVIEKEAQFRLQQLYQDPTYKKKWEESTDAQKQELFNSIKEQSEKAVRIFYLCRKIAADQNMNISPEEALSNTSDPLEMLLFPSSQPHDPRQPDVKQAETYSRVLLEKTEDWIIAHARTAPAEPAKKKEKQAKTTTPSKKPKPQAKKSTKKQAKKPASKEKKTTKS